MYLYCFSAKVDGSFPGRHQDLQPIITWKSSTTPVATDFRLPIPVEHSGSVIDYRCMKRTPHVYDMPVLYMYTTTAAVHWKPVFGSSYACIRTFR